MNDEPTPQESKLIEFMHAVDVRAPQELHERIEALVAARTSAPRRQPATMRWGLSGAVAVAAIVAVLVVSLSGGGNSALTLRRAIALTLRPATMAAPIENPHNGTMLEASVDGVAFPYWEESFGWRSTGARTDRMGGRTVTTVYYADSHHHWIGYAIVAGTPAPPVGGGVIVQRDGTPYRFLTEDGAQVVTWLRDGHLCVVAGHGVSASTLLSLASWHGHGTLAT
jgi:hypothetical protein